MMRVVYLRFETAVDSVVWWPTKSRENYLSYFVTFEV